MFHSADVFFVFGTDMDAFHLDLFIDLNLGTNDAFQLTFQGLCQFFCCHFRTLQDPYLFFFDENSGAVFANAQEYDEQQNNDTDEIQRVAVQFSAAAFSHPFFLRLRLFFSSAWSVAAAFLASAASDGFAAAIGHSFFPFGKHCIRHGNSPLILQKMTNYH